MLKKILLVVVLLLLSAQLLVAVKAAGQAVILQHTGYIDALTGYYLVVGEVQNTGDRALRFVKITTTFYDSAGVVIATDFTYTMIDRLHPGQKSPFEVTLLDKTQSSKVHDYELGVTYEQYGSLPVGLEILSHSKNKDAVGFLHVVGEIKNIGDVDAHSVKVAVTFYDSAGKIVAVSFGFTDPMDLTPGQKAPFEIVLFDLNRSKLATTYALEAQSEEYNIIPEFPAVALILPVAILLALGVLRVRLLHKRNRVDQPAPPIHFLRKLRIQHYAVHQGFAGSSVEASRRAIRPEDICAYTNSCQ